MWRLGVVFPTSYTLKYMHLFPTRIYYEDTDTAGVVYYANYLKFAERARTEALREVGIHQQTLMEVEGLGFVVSKVSAEYKSPARLDDMVEVKTSLIKMSKVRIQLMQEMFRGDVLLTKLNVEVAMVKHGRPHPMSETIRDALVKAFG